MAKRGRPPKKIVKYNPTYSSLKIKKVLQEVLIDDPHNPLLIGESKLLIEKLLTKLDNA